MEMRGNAIIKGKANPYYKKSERYQEILFIQLFFLAGIKGTRVSAILVIPP